MTSEAKRNKMHTSMKTRCGWIVSATNTYLNLFHSFTTI